MLDLRAYNDALFRIDEVLGAKMQEWLKFDERYFYAKNDLNRELLARAFDLEKRYDASELDAMLNEPLRSYFDEGTLSAVKKAVQAIDSGALIIEGNLGQKYDASLKHNGAKFYGSNSHWAEYSIITSKQTSIQTANRIREVAFATAPARCVLIAVENRAAPPTYNGEIRYDKTYNYGTY